MTCEPTDAWSWAATSAFAARLAAGERPLRNQVAGISSNPQGAGREAEAERSGARKLRVDVQKPDLMRYILGRAGGQPRSSRDQRGVVHVDKDEPEEGLAMNPLQNASSKRGIKTRRLQAGWDHGFLLRALCG